MSQQGSIAPIFGIVPAAGLGRRMGLPKQALPFRGSTIVGKVVRTLLNAELDGVVLITRRELVSELDLPSSDRLRVAINDEATSQMIDSVRIGLSVCFDGVVLPDPSHQAKASPVHPAIEGVGVLVVPGDMPGLSDATCRTCMQAFRAAPTRIIIATHAGVRGHPLIFPATLRTEVDGLEGGLNGLAQRFPERILPIETRDAGAVEDVDTWERYVRLTSEPSD